MKILHLSHDGLPDLRVERIAKTQRKLGFQVSFAGPTNYREYFPFNELYPICFSRYGNLKLPYFWSKLSHAVSKIIKTCKPDVIHAHNVVAARLASEFSIPFIYDDHEFWSKQCKTAQRKPVQRYKSWLWSRWEKKVLEKAAVVITVSEAIANEHKRFNEKVFVVPNFPSVDEKPNIFQHDIGNELSSVYVGNNGFSKVPYRNIQGLFEVFSNNNLGKLVIFGDSNLHSTTNIKSVGMMPHAKMMNELTHHHIGLLPWKAHDYHKYCNPNKPYEYAISGLCVVVTSDFPCVINRLKHCLVFKDTDDLKELLVSLADNLEEVQELRIKTYEYAKRFLNWEHTCENTLTSAYKQAATRS